MSDASLRMDPIEVEYERAIAAAMQQGDGERAHELSVGLDQYQTLYKAENRQPGGAQ